MWQPLKTDFSKNKKRKAFIKGSLQFNWWDQRRLRGPQDVKTLDAASLGTLQASELFAEVVKLTECCEILLFKFIIMHESAPIERFTKAWVPKVHLKKKKWKDQTWDGEQRDLFAAMWWISGASSESKKCFFLLFSTQSTQGELWGRGAALYKC